MLVGRHHAAFDHSVAVLPADGVIQHALRIQRLNGAQNFCLLVVDRGSVKRNRRLHRGERDELQDVVGHHVAHSAGFVVVVATQFNAQLFRDRDLHVIDVAAIPHRLENSIREAEGQNVLHRLFAEIVVDAVNLIFLQHFANFFIQRHGAGEVMPERLLDDHAPPLFTLFMRQPSRAELIDHNRKKGGRRSEVEEDVAFRLLFSFDRLQ